MKKLISLVLLLSVFIKAGAQEPFFYQTHRHSVTLSTGFPFVLAMMYPPGSGDNSLTMEGWRTGTGYKTHTFYNFTLGYNLQMDKRWEFAFVVSTCGYVYSQYQYPEKGVDKAGNPTYDWNKNKGQYQGTRLNYRGVYPAVMARYYWLARERCQMYSALGVGAGIGVTWIPLPTLTPVGIRWGRKHWTGHAELTLGTTATALLIGVGYRF